MKNLREDALAYYIYEKIWRKAFDANFSLNGLNIAPVYNPLGCVNADIFLPIQLGAVKMLRHEFDEIPQPQDAFEFIDMLHDNHMFEFLDCMIGFLKNGSKDKVKVVVEIGLETTATIEKVKAAIEKGIYYGLDCPPVHIAPPGAVSVRFLEVNE